MQKPKKSELQKQRKRDIDKRYRPNKKNKQAMTMIENENLKSTVQKLQQEIVQLTKQLNSSGPGPETTYGQNYVAIPWQEIEYLRNENYVAKCLLNDADTSYISNIIKVLKENEEMKRTMEYYQALIAG